MMCRRCVLRAIVLHAACSCIMASSMTVRQDGNLGEADREKAFVTGPFGDPQAGVAVFQLPVPARVLDADIEWLFQPLLLSEPQKAVLARLHDRYLDEDAARRRELLAPLWTRSADMAPHVRDLLTDTDVAGELASIVEDTKFAVSRIIDHERIVLIDMLDPILSDEQQKQIEVVRNRRLRQVYMTVESILPGATVDLAEIMDGIPDPAWADREAFRELMRVYERTLTEAHHNHYDAMFDLLGRGSLVRAREWSSTQSQDQFEVFGRRVLRTQRAIIEAHELFLPILCRHLSPPTSKQLRVAYHNRAHPQVYPNPYDMEQVVGEILAIVRDAKAADAIFNAGTIATEDMREINDRMIAEVDRFLGTFIRTQGMGPKFKQEHVRRLDALHQERRASAERVSAIILAAVPDERSGQVKEVLDAFMQRAAAAKPDDSDGLRYWPARR